jgi:hypothetical protein
VSKLEGSLTEVAAAIAEGRKVEAEQLLNELGSAEDVKKILDKIEKSQKGAPKVMGKIAKILEEMSEQADIEAAAQLTVNAVTGANKILEENKKNWEKIGDSMGKIESAADDVLKIMETGLAESLRRQVDALELEASIAGQTGDASKEVGALLEKQVEFYGQQFKQAKMGADFLKKQAAEAAVVAEAAEQVYEEAKKAKEAGTLTEKELEIEEEKFTAIAARAGTLAKKAAEASKQAADAAKELGYIGDSIATALDEFENSFEGRRIQAAIDLSDATAEFAEFSDNLVGDAKMATKLAIAASKRMAIAQRQAIDKSLKAEQKRIDELVEMAETPEEKQRIRREGEATMEAKKRTELAKLEVQQKRMVLDAAKRETDLRIEDVNIQQEAIEAEADFLSEIGGDFSRIISLQQKGVEFEAQKLAIMEDELAIAQKEAPNAQRTRRLELEVVKQQFEVQKKALGAQKSVFDKIMGAAFGQLRSSAGAGRRRTTTVAKMGIAQTRMRLRSGLYQGAGPGGTGTIAQRSAGMFGAVQRGKDAADAAANVAPERLAIEKEMEKQMRGTGDNTKKTADATANMDANSKNPGSLYTHDVTSEGLLKGILSASEKTADALGNVIELQRTTGVIKPGDKAPPGSDAAKLLDAYTKVQKAKMNSLKKRIAQGKEQTDTIKELARNVTTQEQVGIKPLQNVEKQVAGIAEKAVMVTAETKKDVSHVVEAQEETALTDKKEETAKKDATRRMQRPKLGSAESLASNRLEGKGPASQFGDFTRLEGKGPASLLGKGGKGLGMGLSGIPSLKAKHAAAFPKKKSSGAGAASAKKGGGDIAEMAASDAMNNALRHRGSVASANKLAQKAFEAAGGTGKWGGLLEQPAVAGQQVAGAAGASRPAGSSQTIAGRTGGEEARPAGFAGATASGAGATTSEMPPMKVEGNMTVHFDTAMFKRQLVPILGDVINTPQIVATLQKAGFLHREA